MTANHGDRATFEVFSVVNLNTVDTPPSRPIPGVVGETLHDLDVEFYIQREKGKPAKLTASHCP